MKIRQVRRRRTKIKPRTFTAWPGSRNSTKLRLRKQSGIFTTWLGNKILGRIYQVNL